MLLSPLQILTFMTIFGNIYCTSDVSNPTPVYVVEGGEAVLQCGFESSRLNWYALNGGRRYIIASAAATINDSKYSVSKNPLTGLYYRLHILNIGVSDLKKHMCEGVVNGVIENFYLQLIHIVPPSSLSIENATRENRLLGTEEQNLTVSCKAVGGKPAPNVVLIIDGQTVANQTQSVQHKLTTVNRSYDHKTVTCQASNETYLHNSLTESAMIYLNLKPLQPTITGNVGNIEETKPLVVTCITTGSRPRATLQWTIGQMGVTSNATERSSHSTTSDTYTVISHLTYSLGKSDNGQVLTCKAVNVAVSSGVQTSIALNVKYAPTVSVSDVTYDLGEAIRTVACVPVGIPSTYTFYRWQHKSKYGVLIRELDGGQNGVLTLPSIPVEDRFQDSGEYVCTAGNGIVGRNGNVKQRGSGYAIINAQPIFTNDNRQTQYGEFGGNVDINVYVYSIPKYTKLRWYRGNTQVSSSTKYVVSERPAIVNDTFLGKDIQLDGYRIILTIKNLNESDFNVSYRLQPSYGVSQTVQYTVLLEYASPPQTPTNFTIVSSTDTSIVIEWISGYNGGHEQTFNIQYRILNESKIWITQKIPQYNRQTYTLSGLQGDTWYELRMFSSNKVFRSPVTDAQRTATNKQPIQESSSSALYGGVIGGVVGVIIIVMIILGITFFRRKKGLSNGREKTNSNWEEVRTSKNPTSTGMYKDIEEATSNQRMKDQRNERVETPSTYEMLGMKDTANTYDDLSSEQEQAQSLPITEHYEALGKQDKPNVYDCLKNKEESEEKEYINLKF